MTYQIGDRARITRQWHDIRVWGDEVTVTEVGEIDGQSAYSTTHDVYGDVGWIMFEAELEPIAERAGLPAREGE